MMFWYGGHGPFWPVGLMWAGMIVFLAVLVWAGYELVTSLARRPGAQDHGDGARRILDQRLVVTRGRPSARAPLHRAGAGPAALRPDTR